MFRVVWNDPPIAEDFLSDEDNPGITRYALGTSVAVYRGFSTRATLPQARSLARRMAKHRAEEPLVAEVELTWEEGDAIARTFSRGHHTVWAHPELISRRVIQVHRM